MAVFYSEAVQGDGVDRMRWSLLMVMIIASTPFLIARPVHASTPAIDGYGSNFCDNSNIPPGEAPFCAVTLTVHQNDMVIVYGGGFNGLGGCPINTPSDIFGLSFSLRTSAGGGNNRLAGSEYYAVDPFGDYGDSGDTINVASDWCYGESSPMMIIAYSISGTLNAFDTGSGIGSAQYADSASSMSANLVTGYAQDFLVSGVYATNFYGGSAPTITKGSCCSLITSGTGTARQANMAEYEAVSSTGSYSLSFSLTNANFGVVGFWDAILVNSIFVVGHVLDNSLTPIAGASIEMWSQDGSTLLRSTTTDSNGYYSIAWYSAGTFMVNASKFLYWEERQYVSVSCNGCTGTGDFHLPQDLYYPVANLLVMYASVNTQQSQADLSWSLSAGSTVHVDAYVNPLGGTYDVSTDVTTSGSVSTGSDPTATSLLYQRGVVVHGIFWKQDPSHPINVYVLAQQNVYGQVTNMADYMPSPPSSGGIIQYLPKKTTIQYTYTQSQSFALRYELGVDVSASLEGVGFSTKLASLLVQGQQGVQRSMTIKITNLDNHTHSYYFYFEGSGVLHVWQTT